MNLFAKVGAAVLAVSAVGIAIALLLTFTLTRSVLEAAISSNQAEIARQTTDKIDRLMYERYLDIQSIASGEDLVQFFGKTQNRTTIEKHLDDLTFLTGPWNELLMADKN